MNLFSQKERDAVEDKFHDTPVYDMAEDVCYNCFAHCRTFALHPSELLYLAFYVIDTLRGCEPRRAQKFADRCYNDNITYLRHDKQTGASDDDLHTAVTATLHTAVQWMLDSRQGGWRRVVNSLERQIATLHGDGLVELARGFEECLQGGGERERQLFMREYMQGTTLVSQVIDDLLDELKAAGHATNPIVYGNLVMEQHVEHQIGNVANGGVGMQIT